MLDWLIDRFIDIDFFWYHLICSYETIKRTLTVDHRLELGAVFARNASPSIAHTGLQFLEDIVKFNWPQMKHDQKLLMKNVVFDLISSIDVNGQKTELFILDGIGKIVVEMIKREWPQQWPTMLQEMDTLSARGPVQLQIIMLVFLRFAPIKRLYKLRIIFFQNVKEIIEFYYVKTVTSLLID